MTQAEKWELMGPILLVGVTVLYLLTLYNTYRKNKVTLSLYPDATIVSPTRLRFFLSWFVHFLICFVPSMALVWFVGPEEVFWVSLFFLPIAWLLTSIPAYPYYSLVICDYILAGATVSGWRWKRIEIDLAEIDKERSMRYRLLQKAGFVIFHSVRGEKILTLGLDDLQVSQILTAHEDVIRQNNSEPVR